MEQKHGCAAGCLTILAAVAVIGLLDRSPKKSDKETIPTPAIQPSQPAQPVSPTIPRRVLTPSEVAQRQRGLDIIENITDLLNASSFAKRAEIYCRFYVDQAPSLPILGVHSEKDVEQVYAELKQSEPATREGELRRQYQLRALEERMAAFEQNVDVCEGMVTNGALTIPEPDELRQKLAETQEHMAEFDRDITSGPPQVQDFQPPAQHGPDGAAKPTSGTLCNGPVQVPQNGDLVFKDLPSGALQITFDHDAWQPRFYQQSDGLQTLAMRSIKPGIQTDCYMYWRIAP